MRKTKHVRVSSENHLKLKRLSVDCGETMSKKADEIIGGYFKGRYPQDDLDTPKDS